MPEKRLPAKKNAYRFRGTGVDVIAELPSAAANCIRRGGEVVVTVEWHERNDWAEQEVFGVTTHPTVSDHANGSQ